MIVGIGIDLADIGRIEKSIERFGQRFLDRCFTAAEQAACDRQVNRAARYARRYAAKEAFSKALGTGIGEHAWLTEIEVVSTPGGKPGLRISGVAAQTMQRLAPPGHRVVAHLSITDERPYAQAFVILEALPRED
ncbi:MAG: holo-ACP synthase [Pseudomonadota bacterium]|nr:holo-ACP synthase [Pseudomonadota bacterium]